MILKKIGLIAIIAGVLFVGCGNSNQKNDNKVDAVQSKVTTTLSPSPTNTPIQTEDIKKIDYKKYVPNEMGKVMVVMFHNFVETYTAKPGDDGAYTTTFSEFEKLLDTLYNGGYRLINMKDYLNNQIDVPIGCIPMIFTFDDGTSGQYNLIENNGKLDVNPKSAVGIIKKFNETHKDFGMKGTFYVNLGDKTFDGKGDIKDRLKTLIGLGFEVGNHTYTHINLKETKSADIIQKEIGGNYNKMIEYISDYKMDTFSLPYGAPSKDLKDFVIKGEYQGTKYENKALLEVGWDPNDSPVSVKFNPMSIHRVRASGIKPVQADLAWWLDTKNLPKSSQYISDGNPNFVTVPESKKDSVDKNKLNGKELNIY